MIGLYPLMRWTPATIDVLPGRRTAPKSGGVCQLQYAWSGSRYRLK